MKYLFQFLKPLKTIISIQKTFDNDMLHEN